MSLAKRGADGFYALRLTTLMTMPFTRWEAYKQGIIDAKGEILRQPKTSREKANFTMFHNVVRNLKRLVHMLPGGRMALSMGASYLTLVEQLKNEYDLSDEFVELVSAQLNEAMVAGDSGGDANNIAQGVNSGSITHAGPKTVDPKKKKKKVKRFKHFEEDK